MALRIKDFENLIKPILKDGQEFVSYECKTLLSSGENYGSVMLQVDITIQEDGREEVLHCVAKTCPPPGIVWEIFETKVTFKMEIALYKEIVPTLAKFAKERGYDSMDFFAKCIGARISANPESDVVDADAVLLLENLKMQGYDTCDRFVGFDKDTTKLLLNDLATMHATTIAYKKAKPAEFDKKILTHLKRSFTFSLDDSIIEDVKNLATKSVNKNPKCAQHSFQIEMALLRMNSQSYLPKRNDLFTTLVHHDYWVNNTMVKYEEGAPVSNKIVDFQGIDYHSLANDLTFFLYSSVELSVLQDHIDEMYSFYYEKFIDTLTKLQCDGSAYSFEAMMEECGMIAKEMQFGHLIFLLIPILRLKGKVVDISSDHTKFADEDTIHENYSKRIQFILLDLVQRGWI